MHREISYADRAFGEPESKSGLFLLTGMIGLILAIDLWPIAANSLARFSISLPSWPNEFGGYRLALIAAILGGARILYGSIDSLLQGKLGADLALAIAVLAAILLRESAVAAELVFVGLLGECLEHFTFSRAQRAVRRLAELAPKRCWRLRNGQEERVLVSDLAIGDAVLVKPGAKVPVDGVVLAGHSTLDMSALTGESIPVDKAVGDDVLSGSLNQNGSLTIEAKQVGDHTVLGRVIEMTARALQDRAPSERTADRLARFFLPAVLSLALLTFLISLGLHAWGYFRPTDVPRQGWAASIRYAVYPALSVLVVACPCALILATPAAIIAALGRLAGTGILVKGGSAIERLAGIQAIAFDKTGTLTEGQLELGDITPLGTMSSEELLRLAASAEQHSEHPLARLLVEEAGRRSLPLEKMDDFTAHPGSGVTARIAGKTVRVGNVRFLQKEGLTLPGDFEERLEQWDGKGQTVLWVAVEDRIIGAVGARDQIRPGARKVIEELRQCGIQRFAILTGDRSAVARSVGSQLGIDEVRAELLPQQKAEFIAEWAKCDPPLAVAMIGDGINDAPALAQARVGLAIGGSGTDLAAEAGDVVLMIGPDQAVGNPLRDPLRHIPLLLRLSRETVRIIRQNIVIFAFVVNLLGIVLTAWLWPAILPAQWHESGPIAAVIYHQIGSLLVLLNSMRLLWFEREGVLSSSSWSYRFRSANDWLESRFNVDGVLHWLEHFWREAAWGGMALALLVWLLSGINTIQLDEVGVVRRFGKIAGDDLTPGLHLRWPWPIETVTRLQPGKVRVVELGFRRMQGSRSVPGARSWSSVHSDGFNRELDEAVMLTGDGNLLEVQGSLRYVIDDARRYLFSAADTDFTLRNAAESVIREIVASKSMADLLTRDRARFQEDVLRNLLPRCQVMNLGIRLEGLSLHDLHPPQEVVQAYHEVTRAMERKDREVNQAMGDRIRRLRDQEGRSLETVRLAEANQFERVRLAQARKGEFENRLDARNRMGWLGRLNLLLQAAEELDRGISPAKVSASMGVRKGEQIQKQAGLTDFRIYWETLSKSLTGRNKILIDAEKLPGRRSLWMLPFEPPLAPSQQQGRSIRPSPDSASEGKP